MPPDPPTTDQISEAFAMGWQIAELYHSPVPTQRPSPADSPPEHLPGLSGLHSLQRTLLVIEEILAGAEKVLPTISDELNAAISALKSGLPAAAGQEKDARNLMLNLHVALLTALTAANYRLGKAYGLGRALADTDLMCRHAPQADAASKYKEKFGAERLGNIYKWLADLKSALPDHASYAVSWSLEQWADWVAKAEPGEFTAQINSSLARQAEEWRSLLSGERAGEDLLTATSYVNAAKGLTNQLGRTIGAFVSRYSGTLILSVVLFVVLFGGFIAATIVTGNGKVALGLVPALIAAVGGWRGISSTLGKGLRTVEPKLWDSELDGAIAQSRAPASARSPLPSKA